MDWQYLHKFENQCKTAVSSCFGAVKLRVAFSTRKMLPTVRKDVVSSIGWSIWRQLRGASGGAGGGAGRGAGGGAGP